MTGVRALAFAIALVGCRERVAPVGAPASVGAPVSAVVSAPARIDWAALRVAEEGCADCHADEVAAWRASPMGRSIERVGPIEPARASSVHPRTGLTYTVAPAGAALRFGESGPHDLRDARDAAWAVGSGAHTRSFFWTDGEALYQAPLTWYASTRRWDLSPGYEVADHPGLFREARADCVACHGEPLARVAGTRGRFVNAEPHPIGCGRCHGDARAHAADPIAAKPVVPTKLDPERAQAVCDQCHFSGAVRIPLRDPGDFVPGMRLSDVVAVFVTQSAGDHVGIASHGERLRRSACAKSGLVCTACHAPHRTGPARDRSAACRDCHAGGAHACTGPAGADCAGCHMTRTATTDIPHTSITDHFIRRRPEAPSVEAAGPLVQAGARADPNPRDPEARLLLGMAWAERARQGAGDVEAARRRAIELLGQPPRARGEAWLDLAAMLHFGGDPAATRRAAETAAAALPGNAQAASLLSTARLATDDADGALRAVDAALAAEPRAADLLVQRANVLTALGRTAEARTALDEALGRRPTDGSAWMASGLLALFTEGAEGALPALRRATTLTPARPTPWIARLRAELLARRWDDAARTSAAAGSQLRAVARTLPPGITALLEGARARALLGQGRGADAERLASATLRIHAAAPEAIAVLAERALAAGRADEAANRLEAAVRETPEVGLLWEALARARAAAGRTGADDAARRARVLGHRPGPSARAR